MPLLQLLSLHYSRHLVHLLPIGYLLPSLSLPIIASWSGMLGLPPSLGFLTKALVCLLLLDSYGTIIGLILILKATTSLYYSLSLGSVLLSRPRLPVQPTPRIAHIPLL